MPDQTLDPTRRYLCRHVHTDGRRCGSPALRAQNFCYYHDRTRLPNAPLAGRLGIFKMQPIDDRHAIQIALYDILCRIAAGDVDNKRASILLYGLQIASSNLAHRDKTQPTQAPLEHVTTHFRLGDLAPIQEIQDQLTNAEAIDEEKIPTGQPAETVIPSEAQSAQPRDPRICDPTDLESAPALQTTVIPSEAQSAQPRAPRICDAPEINSPPTPSTPRHSEAKPQNLRISPTTQPESTPLTPTSITPTACITLAAQHSPATPPS
jgi:hypothetical protein